MSFPPKLYKVENRARGKSPIRTLESNEHGVVGLGDRWPLRLPCDCQRSRLGETSAATADWCALRVRWCGSIRARLTRASSRQGLLKVALQRSHGFGARSR